MHGRINTLDGNMERGKQMKHSFKRALAIMLSILLMTSNLGLTAFAEDFTSGPDDSLLIDDVELFTSDVGSEDLFALDDGSGDLFVSEVYSEDIEAPVEEAEPLLLGDIDLGDTDGLTIEPEDVPEEVFEEAPAVPFDQTVTLDGVTFAVTADAGVFPEDAVLRVQEAENAAITEAAETAIGAEGIYTHHLYTIEVLDAVGNVILPDFEQGTPVVRAIGLNLPDDARVTLYDDYAQAAYEINAKVNTDADAIEFSLVDMAVYDIITIEPIPEQTEVSAVEESTQQPADEEQQPIGEDQVEQSIDESIADDQTDQQVDESTEEEIIIEEEVDQESTQEVQPVIVNFTVEPETAVVTVYPAATEETPNPEAIPAQEVAPSCCSPVNTPIQLRRRAMCLSKTSPLQ